MRVLAEVPTVAGSRVDTGDPVAAVPEMLQVSQKTRAQDMQPRKQAQA